MKLVWSRRALADLDEIANYYSINAGPALARSVEGRLIQAIERIRLMPQAAPRLSQRSQVRALAVVRFPFRIFYRLRDDNVDILHIRHTSRRPARAESSTD
jgi:toxin ParE1/3/4